MTTGISPTAFPDYYFHVLNHAPSTVIPLGAAASTVLMTLEPGSPGNVPHRKPGPAYGFVLDGALSWEVEGDVPQVFRAGEAFFTPGGDVIHYRDGNHLLDAPTRLLIVMFAPPGRPMLTPVEDRELLDRATRRSAWFF